MKQKIKPLTGIKFYMVVIFAVLIFSMLFYYAVMKDRYRVKETNGFTENPIITSGQTLNYKTEFCASKLSDLAQEFHFLEREITEQKDVMPDYDNEFSEEEENIISIEQREIPIIKEEFYIYQKLCDQFDINPSIELCTQFIEEAKHQLEISQESTNSAKSKGIRKIEISHYDLRKTNRIYDNLKVICEGFIGE